MDLRKNADVYPRPLGILLALFLPGSAHWLSGRRQAGSIWFLGLLLIGVLAHFCVSLPARGAIVTGLTLNVVVYPLLFIAMLIRSARPIQKMTGKKWMFFILILLAIKLLLAMVRLNAPFAPYRVPTGGMEPTLHGVKSTPGKPDTSAVSRFFSGTFYRKFQASSSGPVSGIRMRENKVYLRIGGEEHELPVAVINSFHPAANYQAGDLLWEGTITVGDHIIMNRQAYLLSPPRRGDIVVFRTEGLEYSGIAPDTAFVKRIVGLPGETVSIQPPDVLINGRPIAEPSPLSRLHYQNGGQLKTPSDRIQLGPDEYLVLGDNADPNQSLDGRFFGAIERESILGKVLTIYWPLSRAGPVE